MSPKPRIANVWFVLIACLAVVPLARTARAQEGRARPLITGSIDESKLIRLGGNTRPEVTPDSDRGIVSINFRLEHMLLQLRRSREQEKALETFVDELHNPRSPNFHHWLTAEQFGERYGLAQEDVDTVTRWLESYGFNINVIYPSRVLIDFSGTAEQVRRAFHTEIHQVDVRGVMHFANTRDPEIPAALTPAVAGIVSLHDFRPHPMLKLRPQYTFGSSLTGTIIYALVPGDLATIYNFNPIFSSGITGQGQTIAVIEDTDLYSTNDWYAFQSTFGLSSYSGTLSTVHPAPPSGPNNCTAPGVNGDDVEATLDAEFALAAAPSAAIEVASCADPNSTTFGGLIAMQNLVNSANPPNIMSVSYGDCEAVNGAAANAAYNSTYQQADTLGISVFVAAGDSGGAGCDQNQAAAASGIAVSGYASTPYNVAVGGTDFTDTSSGTNGTYWGSGNSSDYSSALSYIPEMPWNDSCAGSVLAAYEHYPTTGAGSLCNYASGLVAAILGVDTTAAGSGGPSGCATGTASTTGVASGSCAGWAKPGWQSVFGNPSDGVRDIPDVSLFAANGVWSHYYVFCFSDTANGGAACSGAPSGWTGAGGTSFGAPIMAGVQALINQKTGSAQGNPNPTLYSLANTEYGANGNPSCDSSLGNAVSNSCIFHNITVGDNVVDCTGNYNCFDSAAGQGILSTSSNADQPAFSAAPGWNFGSGLGSVNVANLVNNWPGSAVVGDFSLSANPSSVTIVQGGSGGTSTITVTPINGFSGSVTLSASGLPNGVTASFIPNSTASTSVLTLTASSTAATGPAMVTITGKASGLTHTTTIALTVNPAPNFSLSASPSTVTITQGTAGNSTISITALNGFSSNVSFTNSALPSGVSGGFNPNPASGSTTFTLTASSTAATGTTTVTITGTSGGLIHTTPITLTVNASAPAPNFSLSASPNALTIGRGASKTSTITITPSNGFTGSVTLSATGVPKNVTASFSPSSTQTSSTLTLKVSTKASLATSTVTIKAVSGALSHTTTVTLTVTR